MFRAVAHLPTRTRFAAFAIVVVVAVEVDAFVAPVFVFPPPPPPAPTHTSPLPSHAKPSPHSVPSDTCSGWQCASLVVHCRNAAQRLVCRGAGYSVQSVFASQVIAAQAVSSGVRRHTCPSRYTPRAFLHTPRCNKPSHRRLSPRNSWNHSRLVRRMLHPASTCRGPHTHRCCYTYQRRPDTVYPSLPALLHRRLRCDTCPYSCMFPPESP